MKKKILILILFLFIALLLQANNASVGDQGVIINGAWKMHHGEKIYHDFFEYVGPLTFYLVFFIFKIFTPSYIAVKAVFILLLLSSCWCVYKIYLVFSDNKYFAAISAAAWLLIASFSYSLINHNSLSSILALWLIYIFLSYLKNGKFYLLLSLGLVSFLVFLALQTKGIVCVFWVIVSLYITNRINRKNQKNIFLYLGIISTSILAAFLFWGPEIIKNLLLISGSYLKVNRNPFLSLAIFVLLFFAIFLVLRILYKEKKKKLLTLQCLALLQIFLLISIGNYPNLYHILINSFIAIIFVFFIFEHIYYKIKKKTLRYSLALIAAIFYFSWVFLHFFFFTLHTIGFNTVKKDIYKIIGEENIFAYPFFPGAYFAFKKTSSYYSSTPETADISFIREKIIKKLEKETPGFVITNHEMSKLDFSLEKNEIDYYIEKNYDVIDEFARIQIWKLNE